MTPPHDPTAMPDASPLTKFYARWAVLILAVAAALIGGALYADALRYSLFWDDVNTVRVIGEKTLVELFTTRTALGHYRPLSLLLLELASDSRGFLPAGPMHLLALILHLTNGWLVGLLARRMLPDRPGFHLIAAALYLTFPFSYQAVPWVSSMGHLSAVTGLLAALIFVDRWRQTRRWLDYALTLLGVAVAVFSHEVAVVGAAVIGAWLFAYHYDYSLRRLREDRRTAALILLPALAIDLIYLVLWRALTTAEKYTIVDRLDSLVRNPVYYLQALTYPVTQFGYRFGQQLGLSDYPSTLILAAVGLAFLGFGLWLTCDRRAWFALIWFVLVSLIPIAFLDWNYVLVSPRLLIHASPAIALAWALALAAMWQRRAVLKTGAVLIGALALIGGTAFVRSRLDLHNQMDRLYRDMYAAIRTHGDGALIFNIPAWISPRERVYALGTEGIVYMPDYYSFFDLVEVNTGMQYRTRPALWHDNLPLHDAYWIEFVNEFQPSLEERLAAVREAEAFYRVKALPHQFVLEEASPASPLPEIFLDDVLDFSNGVRLFPFAELNPFRSVVELKLVLETVEGQVQEKLFVHVLCGDEIVAQADGALMGEIYPYDYWSAGETWQETRLIEVPPGISPDCPLQVRLGMYHPATGIRPTLPDGSEWVIIPVIAPAK